MITPEQILKSTGDELSRLAGEVLQPEMKHHVYSGASHSCRNCKKELYTYSGRGTEALHQDCDIATPIPLTWPEAMKWRYWCVGQYEDGGDYKYSGGRFEGAMNTVLVQAKISNFLAATFAQPEHYIKAACLCVLEAKP
jgi:hypothetical protein